ncbi:hypothetical protein J2848_003357 [Azospirillum lipoferum]|nr:MULTISPECIES: phage tail protein [Azospirillum]MCP1611679.1 hypothetical protein [Azospirillum lipoferum]MDW5533562.1 phage tail protein [Azospirillum sp. NL1]
MFSAQVVSSGTSLAYSVLSSVVPLVTGTANTTLTIYVSNPKPGTTLSLQQIAIALPLGTASAPGAGDLTEGTVAIPTVTSTDGATWQASSTPNAFVIELENGSAYSFGAELLTITFSGITVASTAGTVVVQIQEVLKGGSPTECSVWMPKVAATFPVSLVAQGGSLQAGSAQITGIETASITSEPNQNATAQLTTVTATTVNATTVAATTVGATTVNAPTVNTTTVNATTVNANGAIPVGGIVPYAGPVNGPLPNGWFLCDGSAVSRTQYAALFNVINTLYGTGDNSTTFNLPDYRGMFLRGVSAGTNLDLDFEGRTAQNNGNNTGTANPNNNNGIGTRQADQFASHTHTYWQSVYVNSDGNWSGGDWNNALEQTQPTGGSETRPKNVYVYYLIRAE